MKRALLAIPTYGSTQPESSVAAQKCRDPQDENMASVTLWMQTRSLLAYNFNDCVATCLNNGFDYFAMLHSDVAAQDGWLSILLEEMLDADADVIHAPVAIKNHDGFTSTAIAYVDDDWSPKRRITTTELQQLPWTFDVDTIRRHLDSDALWLLPNTGCLLMKADSWLKDFPGFTIRDRIQHCGDIFSAECVPEDWNFGFWCGRNGLRVAGTRKVVTKHYGRAPHPNNQPWGHETDIGYLAEKSGQRIVRTDTEASVV